MESLLFLLGVVVLAIPVALLYLLVSHSRLKTRVAELQSAVARLASGAPEDGAEAGRVPPVTDAAAPPDDARLTAPPPQAAASPWPGLSGKAAADAAGDEADDAAAAEEPAQDHPRAFVFRRDRLAEATGWLARNWFLAVAALSLALAGIFLVQYGVENGLLTPFWRVMGAAALGAALIGAGELVRRRWGDEDGAHTAYLPSTFAGAGVVTLFAAVLAARQLYGLIEPGMALVLLIVVAVVAVVLGWFYGAFLAAVGILGAMASPFVVGGSSDAPHLFYYYFAIVAIAGLLIDAVRRWAWVSAFALITGFGAALLLRESGADPVHLLAFGLILTLAAASVPPLSWVPRHGGAMVAQMIPWRGRKPMFPEFPTRVASGTFAAAVFVAWLVAAQDRNPTELWAAIAALGALFVLSALWFREAPALTDVSVLPPLALLAVLTQQSEGLGVLYDAVAGITEREPETPPAWDLTALVALALAGSALAFWRALSERSAWWAALAAMLTPVLLIALEFGFAPSGGHGAGRWAAHVIAGAALMTLFAERVAKADAGDLRRAAGFTLSSLTLISLALVLMLTETALTLALAVMMVLAAGIDRRLDMKLLSYFVQVGALVTGYRLVIDPGVGWAEDAPLWELWLAYPAAIAGLALAWVLSRGRGRLGAMVLTESGAVTLAGVFATVLLFRWLGNDSDTHWGVGLAATVWLIAMANQLYRLKAGGPMRYARGVLAVLFAIPGFGFLLGAVTLLNPLESYNDPVIGPLVLDSLAAAYLPPAAVFAVIAARMGHLPRWLRGGAAVLWALLAALYVGLEIRRFWRGDDLNVPGVTQPELYSYTVALLLASVAVLFVAFARRSVLLRRIAVTGIALTIAKVFLVDMSGLTGLVRVASFLGLGLSLAGLAWITRRMAEQWDRDAPAPAPEESPEAD